MPNLTWAGSKRDLIAGSSEGKMAEAHPDNVPGPFYVENGCCITCGVPFEVAPDMFDWAEGDSHCFVKRQPCNPKQLDRMLHAMWSSEVECIRYRGADPTVARRIVEFGSGDSCDLPVARGRIRVRDQVRFRSLRQGDTPLAAAARFRAWLAAESAGSGTPYKLKEPRWWNRHTAIFSWDPYGTRFTRFNRVSFFRDKEEDRLTARLRPGRLVAGHGLALTVHEWLDEAERASGIVWSSWDERQKGAPGLHMPI